MEFLLYLSKNFNSNLYGTFLYNCEQERDDKDAKNKTVSIWTDILNNIQSYKNIYYQVQPNRLCPNSAVYKLRFWEEYFLKYNNYVYRSKIFIDYNRNIYVNSPDKFHMFNKLQDKINVESMQVKINELNEVLIDIFEKTNKMSEVYNSFNDTTKFYLENAIGHNEYSIVKDKTDSNSGEENKVVECNDDIKIEQGISSSEYIKAEECKVEESNTENNVKVHEEVVDMDKEDNFI